MIEGLKLLLISSLAVRLNGRQPFPKNWFRDFSVPNEYCIEKIWSYIDLGNLTYKKLFGSDFIVSGWFPADWWLWLGQKNAPVCLICLHCLDSAYKHKFYRQPTNSQIQIIFITLFFFPNLPSRLSYLEVPQSYRSPEAKVKLRKVCNRKTTKPPL